MYLFRKICQKISWECRESNPGLLGEKRKRYLCAMPPPIVLLVNVRNQLNGLIVIGLIPRLSSKDGCQKSSVGDPRCTRGNWLIIEQGIQRVFVIQIKVVEPQRNWKPSNSRQLVRTFDAKVKSKKHKIIEKRLLLKICDGVERFFLILTKEKLKKMVWILESWWSNWSLIYFYLKKLFIWV